MRRNNTGPVEKRIKRMDEGQLLGVLRGLFASIELTPGRRVEFAQRGRLVVDELTARLGIRRETRDKGSQG